MEEGWKVIISNKRTKEIGKKLKKEEIDTKYQEKHTVVEE